MLFGNVKAEGPDAKRIYTIHLFTDCADELIIHWAVGKKFPGEWATPDAEIAPANSVEKPGSLQSKFTKDEEFPAFKSVKLTIPADKLGIRGLNYVLYGPKTVPYPIVANRTAGTTTMERTTNSFSHERSQPTNRRSLNLPEISLSPRRRPFPGHSCTDTINVLAFSIPSTLSLRTKCMSL